LRQRLDLFRLGAFHLGLAALKATRTVMMISRTGSRRICLVLLALLAMTAPLFMVRAQGPELADLSKQLSQADTDVKSVNRSLDDPIDDSERRLLRSKLDAAKAAADEVANQLAQRLALLDARINELGPVNKDVAEAADIQRQRTTLDRQRSAVDSALKRGKLISVEAQQLSDEISQSQADQFSQTVSARSPSPLSPAFWSAISQAFPRDIRKANAIIAAGLKQDRETLRNRVPWRAIFGAISALLILGPGQTWARRLGQRLLTQGAPGHRVRRSAYALWRILVGAVAPFLASALFVQGLRWSALAPKQWDGLLTAFIAAMTFTGLTVAILGALLMRSTPSWRMIAISDVAASRLRPLSLLLGALAFVAIMLTSFNRTVGASAAANVAAEAVLTLLHLLLIGATLVVLGRLRTARQEAAEGVVQPAQAGSGAIALLCWLLLIAALLCLALGYIGASLFLVQLITWAVVLGSGTYLVMAAVDDVATTLFDRTSPFGVALVRSLGLRGSLVDQFGVLLSGVVRLMLGIIALGLLLSPFGGGDGIGTLFGRLGVLAQGFEVGGVAVSPGAIFRGLVVLLIGLSLVRAFMRWLETRYLPATDLDGSGRNSVSLVARYVGIALAAIWGLASLGIGIERIAILLSALSVGIGFGLQAITQNFVSGLILLAERPIKIGDLVRVGSDEGDVKRISVRSTEIELADHSTLIVPNSELITKSVLNKTMASPLGRLQIQFSVPIEADADKIREIVLSCFREESTILLDPAPSIFIDSIADGKIFFNSFAHVATPRAAYRARSNVLIMILRQFREANIEIGTVPQRLELVAPASPAEPLTVKSDQS
jgi:small-conductance mechanosensitive channel